MNTAAHPLADDAGGIITWLKHLSATPKLTLDVLPTRC